MPFDFVPTLSQRQFLAGRTTLQLDNAEGSVITVASGCLWVTMQNDPRDVVLTPGMRFEIDRSGRTLVAAEEDSRFELLTSGKCPKGMAAWLACKFSQALSPEAQRRRWVPHY